MSDTHTQGPWLYRPSVADRWTVASAEGQIGTIVGKGNAALVAAAPQLLAALIKAEEALHYSSPTHNTPEAIERHAAARKTALDALYAVARES